MEAIIDLHIHSRYSRACSDKLTLPNIAKACEKKGITLVSTGDFTHPLWFEGIQNELAEVGHTGLFRLKDGSSPTLFIIGTEISLIYRHKDKTRRLHILIFCPSIETAEKFNNALSERGCNLRSDGRPILGLSAVDIMEIVNSIDERIMVIPAHAWTPWFAVFGSKSGYDSLEECFEQYTSQIFSIETGLSSDPAMNHRLSALDKIVLVSNSDAHSLEKLGREANVMEFSSVEKISFEEIKRILKTNDRSKFLYTIEFYPEEGMYHYDGHRDCKISLAPNESKQNGLLCPKCKKKLTIGVVHRVDDLADREENSWPDIFVKHKYIVPLQEIIAQAYDVGVSSKKVLAEYERIISGVGNEFYVLLKAPIEAINKVAENQNIGLGISNMRSQKLTIKPGFDGVYGVVNVYSGKHYKTQQKLILE